MIAANRIGSAPGSRATDIISGADGGTLVLSRTRCLHYAASRRSTPDTAWPGRRPSLIPSRRARAPYRGTRENNLPTPPCREPPTPLIRGHFFHPPLVRGRCLYPPDKGVALVEGFFIGHSPRDARPLKGGVVVSSRRSRRTLIHLDFSTIPAYGETLSLRVRNARVCDDSLDLGCDDAQDTTHLPLREDVTGQKVAAGRSPGFRIILLTAPSRRHPPVVMAVFVPGHSGGSAPDSHRLPGLSLRKPTCDRSEKRYYSINQRATYESGRY